MSRWQPGWTSIGETVIVYLFCHFPDTQDLTGGLRGTIPAWHRSFHVKVPTKEAAKVCTHLGGYLREHAKNDELR